MPKLSFKEKAALKHNNKYNYDKVNYVNSATKVIITCVAHGDFLQRPADHIRGSGCPKCGTKSANSKNKKSKNQILKDFKKVHNDSYDYSKIEYKDVSTPITIICLTHGEFHQRPYAHLKGAGCPKCGQEKANKKNTLQQTSFIEKANKIHNNYYSYTKTVYKKMNERVIITCPVHGDFIQLPYNHIRGAGCNSCTRKGFDPGKPATLYYLKINNGEAYKIGITNRTINERFSIQDLKKIEVIFTKHYDIGQKAREKETKILANCKKFKLQNSTLLESGNSELFKINIINYFKDDL